MHARLAQRTLAPALSSTARHVATQTVVTPLTRMRVTSRGGSDEAQVLGLISRARVVRSDLADRTDSRAATIGRDIHLGSSETVASDGGRLLAHELAHVVQQRGTDATGEPRVSRAVEHERAADSFAAILMSGRVPPIIPAVPRAACPIIQRQEKPSTTVGAPPAPPPKKPVPRGGNILYIGVNMFASELPALQKQYEDSKLQVRSVTATKLETKFRVGKKTFDLTGAQGVKDFVATFGLGAADAQTLEDVINLHAPGERDEIANVIRVYAATESDGRDRMSRVVLSGHIGSDSVHSDTSAGLPDARVKFEGLVRLQGVFPKAAAQVKHLMVAACFGGEESLINKYYIKAFPNVKTIEGWTVLCPSPTSAAIGAWARRTDSDPTQAPKLGTGRATWSGGVYQGDMPLPVAETMANFQTDETTFQKYVSGDLADPSAGQGWLARYYERLHNAQARIEITGADRTFIDEHVFKGFRLRHWKAMTSQFWKKHKSTIQAGYGSATSPDYSKLSRKDALAAIGRFDTEAKGTQADKDAAAALLHGVRDLTSVLEDTWTTP